MSPDALAQVDARTREALEGADYIISHAAVVLGETPRRLHGRLERAGALADVRERRHDARRARVLGALRAAGGDEKRAAEALELSVASLRYHAARSRGPAPLAVAHGVPAEVPPVEKIVAALAEHGWRRRETALALGIHVNTVRRRVRGRDDVRPDPEDCHAPSPANIVREARGLREALDAAGGNVSAAARAFGVQPAALRRRMKRAGVLARPIASAA